MQSTGMLVAGSGSGTNTLVAVAAPFATGRRLPSVGKLGS